MVHRIQNRNPGYSDFSNTGSVQSFNFSNTASNPSTNGANALKLENEVIQENEIATSTSELMSEQVEVQKHEEAQNIVEEDLINKKEQSFTEEAIKSHEKLDDQPLNGLENFDIEEETPELFNVENESSTETIISSENERHDSEEDDLEIPAFLRRQKN
jgi:cell division protein FtsZ